MIELARVLLPVSRLKLEASKPRWKLEAGSSQRASASLTSAERRTLWAILGFLAGLAALGPVAALGAATLASLAARFSDPR